MNTSMARFARVVLCALALGLAHAQVADTGVAESRDEFTGAYSCGQMVVNSPTDFTGVTLSVGTITGFNIFVTRQFTGTDWTFNSLSPLPRPNDLVYFRFSEDDVISLKPDGVDIDRPSKLEMVLLSSRELAARIMAAPTDIRVRFSGMDGNRDFTILHAVVVALAEGFGQSSCWE